MFGNPFYFSLLRKYVILVGTLFNNIRITRIDKDGNTTALIKVPVTYAPKDKMLARVIQDASVTRQTAVTPLPVISFEMGQMKYDSSRKLPTINRIAVKDPTNKSKFKYQYNPVPYNIDFKVYVYAKNAEDGTKIIEQILPFFTPDWTTTVNLIPEMEITTDIPVVLNNISYTDNYSGDLKDRRAIIWQLDVTLKGYIYGPVKSTGVIKFVKMNFYTPSVPDGTIANVVGTLPVVERVTVQPGLTANGLPTSNINETVAYTEISIDDDYGFITQIYDEKDLQNE
jgi:hypothetical protein